MSGVAEVYDQLRALAAARLTGEAAGHTLDATALVHEAYLKLAGRPAFASRTDYLKAAAVAMRFFARLTKPEAAEALGVSVVTTARWWKYTPAWL